MITKQFIDQLKQDYTKIHPPVSAQESWLIVEKRLTHSTPSFLTHRMWVYAFVLIMIFSCAGVVVASQFSKPGQPLYGLRQVADPIMTAIGGNTYSPTPNPTSLRDTIKSEQIEYPVSTPTQVNMSTETQASPTASPKTKQDDEKGKQDIEKENKQPQQQIQEQVEEETDEKELENNNEGKKKKNDKKWYNWFRD